MTYFETKTKFTWTVGGFRYVYSYIECYYTYNTCMFFLFLVVESQTPTVLFERLFSEMNTFQTPSSLPILIVNLRDYKCETFQYHHKVVQRMVRVNTKLLSSVYELAMN